MRPGPGEVRSRVAQAGDAEVHQLDVVTRLEHHDVLRLHVTMHDIRPVSGLQPLGDLGGEPDRAGQVEPPVALDHLVEHAALQPLHDDEHAAVFGLVEVVDQGDARIPPLVQARHQLGLLLEARDEAFLAGEVAPEDLQGHLPADAELLGQVHGPHAAAPGLALDAIAPLDDAAQEGIGPLARPAHGGAVLRTDLDVVRIVGLADGAVLHRELLMPIESPTVSLTQTRAGNTFSWQPARSCREVRALC